MRFYKKFEKLNVKLSPFQMREFGLICSRGTVPGQPLHGFLALFSSKVLIVERLRIVILSLSHVSKVRI